VTVWSVMPETSDYFSPSTAPFMVNYRVADPAAPAAGRAGEMREVNLNTAGRRVQLRICSFCPRFETHFSSILTIRKAAA